MCLHKTCQISWKCAYMDIKLILQKCFTSSAPVCHLFHTFSLQPVIQHIWSQTTTQYTRTMAPHSDGMARANKQASYKLS